MIKKKKATIGVFIVLITSIMFVSLMFLLPPFQEAREGDDVDNITIFSSIWDTTNPGTSNYNQVALPLEPNGNYNFTVDWGDGKHDTITAWNQSEATHSYSSRGIYTIRIDGNIVSWRFNNGGDRLKLLEIDQWGCLRLGNLGGYFYGCENLVITARDILNLTGTTILNRAFMYCLKLVRVESMNDWDVSKVIDMSWMFMGAANFNQDISSWNTSNVNDMSHMFHGARSFNQDISRWNVSSVIDMSYMFSDAYDFNKNIGNWDVSCVTDMSYMFHLASVFNQDIGGWNVSNVKDMESMFSGITLSMENYENLLIGWASLPFLQSGVFFHAGKSVISSPGFAMAAKDDLETIYHWMITDGGMIVDYSLTFSSRWDTRNSGVSNSSQIRLPLEPSGKYDFLVEWGDKTHDRIRSWNQLEVTHTYSSEGTYTVNITGIIIGWRFNNVGDQLKLLEIEHWGGLRLGNSGSYFYGCNNLIITASDVLNLMGTTDLSKAFMSCGNVRINKINEWEMSSVSNMSYMFHGASGFNQYIGDWDVSSVTDMSYMFSNARSFNGDISGWNVSSVTDMSHMFSNAQSFGRDIGGWDVSSVTDMSYMFYWCIDPYFNPNIGGWNVSSVTDMSYMFYAAIEFNQNIGDWDVSSVTDMSHMFDHAEAFNQNIGGWDVSSVTDMSYMFYDLSFNQNLGDWNVSSVTNMEGMFRDVMLSTANYDSLLIGWSKLPLQYGVWFNGGDSRCSAGAARDARTYIIDTFNWHIIDYETELNS
ncbi:MAG: BspA family leucine-rich repeat surface protein [Promethearchaeota archaeon]